MEIKTETTKRWTSKMDRLCFIIDEDNLFITEDVSSCLLERSTLPYLRDFLNAVLPVESAQSAPATPSLREAANKVAIGLDNLVVAYIEKHATKDYLNYGDAQVPLQRFRDILRTALAADPAPLSGNERRELEALREFEKEVRGARQEWIATHGNDFQDYEDYAGAIGDALNRLDAAKGAKG